MGSEGSSRSPLTEEQIERYKKMTREEVDALDGMERERAKYHSGHSSMTTVSLTPKELDPSSHIFPAGGCVINDELDG